MFKFILIVLTLYINTATAKPISEYFSEIEPLLIEKKYSEADALFKELNPRLRSHAVKGDTVGSIYKKTIKWLKKNDEVNLFLKKVSENKNQYKANGNYGISQKNCSGRNCEYYHKSMIKGNIPKSLPFSSNFISYINNYRKESYMLFSKENQSLNKIEKETKNKAHEKIKLAREKYKKEAKQKREKEERTRKLKEEKIQNSKNKEISKINKLAKKSGYSGYTNDNVISLIYKTQNEGGLEKHLNKVVGCHKLNKNPCEKWYPKLKAIQILDKGVLYSFSEFSGGKHVAFTVFSDKTPGKIYQEGQAFENSYHAFKGMFSYKTVLGVQKTVPSFYKAKL